MKKIISLLAILIAALSMTAFASAREYKLVMCNAKQAPKTEMHCAQRNIYHARGALHWVKQVKVRPLTNNVQAATRLLVVRRDMTWLLQESKRDKNEAQRRLITTLPLVNDWQTAVSVAQRIFPGTASWLLSCSAGEGGHGKWVPQAQGGTPGGWMQYKPGTFVHDFDAALAYARAHGFVVPTKANSWYSALGQALAGGWAYGHDRPSGKWTGGGC